MFRLSSFNIKNSPLTTHISNEFHCIAYNATRADAQSKMAGNWQKSQAKFAKQYGLVGVIMYMDAQNYAPEGVKTMPDGPGLPKTGIQRGTLKDGLGDPSTYLYPSTSKHRY